VTRGSWGTSGPGASPGRAILALVAVVVLGTVGYYLVPVPGQMRESSWAILFGGGVVALAALIAAAIWRLLRAAENVRIRVLVLLLVLTVLFFSWADDSVARLPGQFDDLHTKTDALYFTVSTIATVGFGDVHAVGQLARAAVTVQIVFNLVFLGAAVAMISGFLRERAQSRRTGGRRHEDGASPVPDDRDGAR
jgi:voltage-gated potassium channel